MSTNPTEDAEAVEKAVAEAYDEGARTYCDSWREAHPWLEEQRRLVASILPAGASVLDVGCGPGHDAADFQAKGFNVLGIDVSPQMIELARLSYPRCAFEVMSLFDVRKLCRTFDAIWLAYVILHVPRVRMPELIEVLRSIMTANGILFLVTSIADGTVEQQCGIAGLRAPDGKSILVYTVRWQIDELRSLFSKKFEELYEKVSEPLPVRPPIVSSLWRNSLGSSS
jgi:2-polyprenyl-3-methyl-5-hydroxy-6-metoxy-1,4-benzoquinol methylase